MRRVERCVPPVIFGVPPKINSSRSEALSEGRPRPWLAPREMGSRRDASTNGRDAPFQCVCEGAPLEVKVLPRQIEAGCRVAGGNCGVERPRGEQPEAKDQSVETTNLIRPHDHDEPAGKW